jgi:hypothetical protein
MIEQKKETQSILETLRPSLSEPIGKYASGKFGGKAKYKLLMDSPQSGVEKNYFSILRTLTDTEPFGRGLKDEDGYILKTKDIYTAGETSSYWGNVEARKGAQIDKFQQIMQNVGSMIKAMFQLIRELRILEERLSFYKPSKDKKKSSEVHLKSVWIDQVEGGAKNPSSVMGLTTQVGFAALADLFFTIHPKNSKEIEQEVNKLKESHGINKKVREVLSRKLLQYFIWKEKTEKELEVGQKFKLQYLRQHYAIIRLYLNWLRPYLKNIQRLQMKTEGITTDKDVIAAFETSKIELEFIAIRTKYKKETGRGKAEVEFKENFPIVRVQLNFVAIPQMSYQQEYQRGAIHSGRTEITIEGTVAKKKDIENYIKKLEQEDMALLSVVDSSMEALKEELTYYLEKAGGAFDIKKEEKKEEKHGLLEPFTALKDFFKDIIGTDFSLGLSNKSKVDPSEKGAAKGLAKLDAYLAYYIFKKQNKLITE